MNESFYADQVASSLDGSTKRSGKLNFRCNICGDSEKNLRKKRAWIYEQSGTWMFHCFNCGVSMKFTTWLKQYQPDHYRSYLMDNLNSDDKSGYEVKTKRVVNLFSKREPLIYDFYKDCKFSSIINNDTQLAKDAIRFCQKRRIPEETWKKFLVCTSGRLRNRLVIPYFDKSGDIVFFSARKIYDHTEGVKYVCQIGDKYIYNLDFVDTTKPVIVVEGPVDAMFIENSVAMTGAANMEIEHVKAELFYILDNDDTGRRESLKLLKKGKNVFNWKKYLEDKGLYYSKIKDINDLILKQNIDKIRFEDVKDYFTNSLVDTIWFQ